MKNLTKKQNKQQKGLIARIVAFLEESYKVSTCNTHSYSLAQFLVK